MGVGTHRLFVAEKDKAPAGDDTGWSIVHVSKNGKKSRSPELGKCTAGILVASEGTAAPGLVDCYTHGPNVKDGNSSRMARVVELASGVAITVDGIVHTGVSDVIPCVIDTYIGKATRIHIGAKGHTEIKLPAMEDKATPGVRDNISHVPNKIDGCEPRKRMGGSICTYPLFVVARLAVVDGKAPTIDL